MLEETETIAAAVACHIQANHPHTFQKTAVSKATLTECHFDVFQSISRWHLAHRCLETSSADPLPADCPPDILTAKNPRSAL